LSQSADADDAGIVRSDGRGEGLRSGSRAVDSRGRQGSRPGRTSRIAAGWG